ncbi:VCBS repeat-containing protein [Fulvivirgaceae bacterium BMA12]|uniref:VCBS repeat-containing protein n=1 Tax=Agaribacillus aureus TaxID=3051825 RepID=A0ABT8L2U6_9BACT|nr:VCBS repeat-containing protein [Fulvivirgaceae bacterium BMA12]
MRLVKISSIWILKLVILLAFQPLDILTTGCQAQEHDGNLLQLMSPEQTDIKFVNKIIENETINILTYEYFHNGGGVAIGDINNDDLPDVYLTGNLVPNRLYLNLGNLKFKDITQQANVGGTQGWNTGVTMVDVNQDGFLDIYVCLSGNLPEAYRANQLYINNGDLTFTEQAASYGIADTGFSTHATFFDYDLDNDLDLFVLNHNVVPLSNFKPSEIRNKPDKNVGDKLYRNDGGKFTEVTQQAGIISNALGYGLGVSVGDLNNDNWPDIYVANDFLEHDYLYFNNGDGTFTESVKSSAAQISQFSMGTDMADFNNDGLIDILSVDMLAEDNYRQKTTMRPMDRHRFYHAVEDGFHYQYMQNALQLNRGQNIFSNVSQIAGVSNTDWSWAPLFLDIDLDGHKDLMVTNGYKKDISNKDYVAFEKKQLKEFQAGQIERNALFRSLLDAAPSTKIRNFLFKNNGDLTFTKLEKPGLFDHVAFSNGAAYGDLDNDGDLDLVVNNIDEPVFVYKNNIRETTGAHYIKLKFSGSKGNLNGMGARVWVHTGDQMQLYENQVSRGFQSSVENRLLIGLAESKVIDKLVVQWPDGKMQTLKNLDVNRQLTLNYQNARQPEAKKLTETKRKRMFEDITSQVKLSHTHTENPYDDFELEVLLPHKMSTFGPGSTTGDVNGDGLEDIFTGGASGYPATLFLQSRNGEFKAFNDGQPWLNHRISEDIDCSFLDIDNDGDLDLYVVSGGNEFPENHVNYKDRIYINQGDGKFYDQTANLPEIYTSGACVKPHDFDNDGDIDLFIGGRQVPGSYPMPANSYLLRNDNGRFIDVTPTLASELTGIGMVTDAVWLDYDGDADKDLIIVGEWMAVTILEHKGHSFALDANTGLENSRGWWFSVAGADIDQDGDMDLVGGNLGWNYKYKTSEKEPFQVYRNDFDNNGTQDIVLGYFNDGKLYPVRGRQCSAEQMPFIKQKFPTYDLFGKAELDDIYGKASLNQSLHLITDTFASSYLENLGNGKYAIKKLPIEAQLSAVNGIILRDFDGDLNMDLLLAGNHYASEVETPRNDAGIGLWLRGDGKGGFEPVAAKTSGLYATGDTRDLDMIRLANGDLGLLQTTNNDRLRLFAVQGENKSISSENGKITK